MAPCESSLIGTLLIISASFDWLFAFLPRCECALIFIAIFALVCCRRWMLTFSVVKGGQWQQWRLMGAYVYNTVVDTSLSIYQRNLVCVISYAFCVRNLSMRGRYALVEKEKEKEEAISTTWKNARDVGSALFIHGCLRLAC